MVAWFIIGIATLAIFAFIAINGVQTISMTSDAMGRIESVRRLDAAVNGLMARAASPSGNGVMYLPAGQANASGEGYNLPQDLAQQSVTPFGKSIVYCPFGDGAAASGFVNIPNADGTSYRANLSGLFNGRTYVMQGRGETGTLTATALAQNKNVIGFVMAPRSKLSEVPSCNDISYNLGTKKFSSVDAIVRPLTRDHGVDETRTEDARRVMFYVSPTGGGTGASPEDPASLGNALAYYRSHLPSSMTINMAAGGYGMSAGELYVPPQSNNFHSNLSINGVVGSSSVDVDTITGMSIPGDLVLNGVVFDAEGVVQQSPAYKLIMINSSVGGIDSYGEVQMSGTNYVTGRGLSINNGSAVYVKDTLNIGTPTTVAISVASGGRLIANSAVINLNTINYSGQTYGIHMLGGSMVKLSTSTVNVNRASSSGVYNSGGSYTMYNSLLNFSGAAPSYGIMLRSGAQVDLSMSDIGSSGLRPNTGIYDNGAASISGFNSTDIYATNFCWQGGLSGRLFVESGDGALNGSTSSVSLDVTPVALSASPTGPQIQTYTNTQAQNARRAALRILNTSEWLCHK